MAVTSVTLAPLTTGPSIDSRTATFWLQIAFSAGAYPKGGVPAGIDAFVDKSTVDSSKYLGSNIDGENTVVDGSGSLPTVGGILYKYIPTTDKIQLFDGRSGLEFTESEQIPPAVLNDTIVGSFVYNRV